MIGGIEAGATAVAVAALALLALGFLGLCHALIEAVAGRRRRGGTGATSGRRGVTALALACLVLARGPGRSGARASRLGDRAGAPAGTRMSEPP